jgi:UDP-N-acetylmuramoyl-tripeptide--D-alanyl-D-alanine ligase
VSWTLPEILAATGGELLRWGPGPFSGFSTDSRTLVPGEVFVALRGPRFDGGAFLGDVAERGASAAIVSSGELPGSSACVRVDDCLRALGDLAAAWRRQLSVRVVGVTGSNGKTTTKEMIAAVLAAAGATVAKSRGTENNLVGLPRTLLGLSGEEDFAVLEMGMNHPGEIWRLAEISRPDVGVITNVGPAHLENLGSLANVAAAKEELALALPPRATLILNGDDLRLVAIGERFRGRTIVVGGSGPIRAVSVAASPRGQHVEVDFQGQRKSIEIAMRGAHNVANALLALATGVALGLTLDAAVEGLQRFTPPPMRLEVVDLPSGARVLNDAYNANPASMEAALAALAAEPGRRRIAVLGEMWELGDGAGRYHREVGRAAGALGIDQLVAVGRHADEMAEGAAEAGLGAGAVERAATTTEAGEWLAGRLGAGDVVLVKGSRAAHMEAVVQGLRSRG